MTDQALFDMVRARLFTAVVGDALDLLGYRRQFLPQAIARALDKAETENQVAIAIRTGMSTVEAFDRFGVM